MKMSTTILTCPTKKFIFPLQLTREPLPFPKLRIKRKVENIEDFSIDDLEVEGYKSHGKVEMKMAV